MSTAQNSMPPEHGIHTIDTGFQRPGFDAAYLIVENGRGAFVDCGTNHSVPRLLGTLEAAGLHPADVDWLILTHVHLDHAGGAGELMSHLPHARLLVHPRGARHMIDPSKLWAGASAVYGDEEMQRSYGRLVPVAAERVVEAPDGHRVELAGRSLRCIDTPGHASHHICIWDVRSRCWFSGDTFGLSYREFDSERGPFVIPTTSPVQFHPEALHRSIRRLCEPEPAGIYPTHFGRVGDVSRMAQDLHATIDAMVALARAADGRDDRHAWLVRELGRLYVERAAVHGCRQHADEVQSLLCVDIELNAQGLEVWLDRAARRAE